MSQKQATAAAGEQPIGRLRADDLICMRVVAGLGMASAVAAWSEGSTRPRQWVCVPTHPRSVPKVKYSASIDAVCFASTIQEEHAM